MRHILYVIRVPQEGEFTQRRYGLDLLWGFIMSPGKLSNELVAAAQTAFTEVFNSRNIPTAVR